MKRLLTICLLFTTFNLFANGQSINEAKIICGISNFDTPMSAVDTLNRQISQAQSQGYREISAPAFSESKGQKRSFVCVTISK